MSTTNISCLTTSYLPWFMDLTFQVPMQYCSLHHQTLLPSLVTFTTGYCFYFRSVSSFFWSYFSTDLQCILGTYWPGEFIFQCPIFLPFHAVHWVLKARILRWFFPSLLQWTTFCDNCPPWPIHLGYPTCMAHSFIELDHLWSRWLSSVFIKWSLFSWSIRDESWKTLWGWN